MAGVGRRWKKGQSGNPKGAQRIPADIKEARKLNQIEFEKIANKYLYSTPDQIKKVTQNPDTPVLDLLITSILHKAVVEGDEKRLEFLLTRLLGKVPDKVINTVDQEVLDAIKNFENKSVEELEDILKLK